MSSSDLSEWNFLGQDLSSAFFAWSNLAGVDFSGAAIRGSDFGSASLVGAVLTSADARVTDGLSTSIALTHNLIDADGHINTLEILPDETMRLWDLEPNLVPRWQNRPVGDVPILVLNEMSIASTGTLRAVFENDQWGSTRTFDSGIPVTLGW